MDSKWVELHRVAWWRKAEKECTDKFLQQHAKNNLGANSDGVRAEKWPASQVRYTSKWWCVPRPAAGAH